MTLTPQQEIAVLAELAAAPYPKLVIAPLAGRFGITLPELQQLAKAHGYPDQERLAAAVAVMRREPTGKSNAVESDPESEPRALSGLAAIRIDQLRPSPNNPRLDLEDIDDLAQSISEVGLIQPIVVQRVEGEPGFQIVAGHRRYAAMLRLDATTVPCLIRRSMRPDDELLAMLVENGQRAGLDPIEEARALGKLKASGLSDAEIGRKVGRGQVYVSNRLVLLALPAEEQEQLRAGGITIGAATKAARIESGRTRPAAVGKKSAQHFSLHHDLGTRARARCQRLKHRSKGASSVGGVACGECWESVIRSDERDHLTQLSNERGRCVLCDSTQTSLKETA